MLPEIFISPELVYKVTPTLEQFTVEFVISKSCDEAMARLEAAVEVACTLLFSIVRLPPNAYIDSLPQVQLTSAPFCKETEPEVVCMPMPLLPSE